MPTRKKIEKTTPENEQPTSEQPTVEQPVAEAAEGETERSPIDKFLYHQRRALEEASKAIDALLPEGFKTHSAEAQKEFHKSFKVLIDAAITELEKVNRRAAEENNPDDAHRPSSTGKVKVKVQVE